MVTIISCLFFLEATTFITDWSFIHNGFVQNGWDYYAVFGALQGHGPTTFRMALLTNIDGGISTVLADVAMVFQVLSAQNNDAHRFYSIDLEVLDGLGTTMASNYSSHPFLPWWNRYVNSLQLFFSQSLTDDKACKVIQSYHYVHDSTNNISDTISYKVLAMWTICHLSLTVATTMICTILIICRILISGRASQDGMQLYRGIIEILVESALLYSTTLFIYTGFVARNNTGGSYVEIVAAVARGIAPTLTIGRVAAGHARPNDSWTASAASSLRFGASSHGQSQDSMDKEAVEDESVERKNVIDGEVIIDTSSYEHQHVSHEEGVRGYLSGEGDPDEEIIVGLSHDHEKVEGAEIN
ncbi:hypothetical protein ARMSODRAFT_1026327 [Armillaria solidipes]|uniref:TRP C-terminal domain-containing protein n=1 Tax=Armillaria solidipes TaxID=1076256 RepID=A0A2H3BCH8_9AGAR|nr:hypothetical protein ARMSODRAFT_1026327 [Armillaria solidipes]